MVSPYYCRPCVSPPAGYIPNCLDAIRNQTPAGGETQNAPEELNAIECVVDYIAGNTTYCLARLWGKLVPVAMPTQVLETHGLKPNMWFRWRTDHSHDVRADDILPLPLSKDSREHAARLLFTDHGIIEGPGSMTLAYELTGPLGPQGVPEEAEPITDQEKPPTPLDASILSSIPDAGVPYALRPRKPS